MWSSRRRRGRTGEIEDLVDLDPARAQARRQGLDDVRVDHVEAGLAFQVTQILPSAGLEVVESDHVRAFRQKRVAQVRTKESRASSHQDELAFPVLHATESFRKAGIPGTPGSRGTYLCSSTWQLGFCSPATLRIFSLSTALEACPVRLASGERPPGRESFSSQWLRGAPLRGSGPDGRPCARPEPGGGLPRP